MCDSRKYYEAYDDRYRQVHGQGLQWFARNPSHIVADVIRRFGISPSHCLLELGCGEGRDAKYLLEQGYDLLATDISAEAVNFCRKLMPQFSNHFRILNCVSDRLDRRFQFIYAIAVVHMLVEDADRAAFYRFVSDHLTENGIALICTMGDGTVEQSSDIATAFELQKRVHEQTGKTVHIAGTSYRAVSFETFDRELQGNGLRILEQGLTDIEPDYWKMMYAVVKKS